MQTEKMMSPILLWLLNNQVMDFKCVENSQMVGWRS